MSKKKTPKTDAARPAVRSTAWLGDMTLNRNGEHVRVARADYIQAKTKALREFGYPTLTENEVAEQLEAILQGRTLNVIGMFMEDDVVVS